MISPMQLSSPTMREIIFPSPPATLVPDCIIGEGIRCLRSLSFSVPATSLGYSAAISDLRLRQAFTVSFLSSTDSPVIADSSQVSCTAWKQRPSTGMFMPYSTMMTSPTCKSLWCKVSSTPFRKTRH